MTVKPDFQAQMRSVEEKTRHVVTIGNLSGDPIVGLVDCMSDLVRLGVTAATAERPALTTAQVRTLANAILKALSLRLVVTGVVLVVLAAGMAGGGAYAYAGGFWQQCGVVNGVPICWWVKR